MRRKEEGAGERSIARWGGDKYEKEGDKYEKEGGWG